MLMHPDQIELDEHTVRSLVDEQFPCWRELPITPITSHGTVNALFRLGTDFVLRFPIQGEDPEQIRNGLQREMDAARRLLGRMPVATPEPVGLGGPGMGYSLPWSIYRWLPGQIAYQADVSDSVRFAEDLAGFVLALRTMDTEGATFTGTGRGGLLPSQDEAVARYLGQTHGIMDVAMLTELWERLRESPRDGVPDVWTHGDLMPGNLLVRDGRLAGVIDVGGVRPADPALDLMPAWNMLTPRARAAYRAALGAGEAEWARGKGWAFAQAIGCLAYYRVTNPVMSRTARFTLEALIADGA